MREAECGVSFILHKSGGDANMVSIDILLLFIYILFIYLVIVTATAVALFVALIVTIRKHENQKNTSLPGR